MANNRQSKVDGRCAPPRAIWRLLRSAIGVVALLAATMVAAQAAIPASERAVLDAIYAQTNGAGWVYNFGWGGPPGTECYWYGVTCNTAQTSVIGIDLSTNDLYGVLPPLDGLTNLESFIVQQVGISFINSLYGPIPPLNGLKHLKTFIATSTNFSGDLPSLAGMSSLEHFECGGCALDGHIESLAGLTNLKYFEVTGNPEGSLHGSIPSLAGSPQLQYFRLQGQFTGQLPDLSGLTQLQTFRVRGFRFTGGLPDLVDLPDLEWFDVHGLVSGQFGRLANLPNLQTFDVSQNLLSGSMPQLAGTTSLQSFRAGDNLLSGSIPSLSQLPDLETFDVTSNWLSGSIPSLSLLPSLQTFAVGANQLTGSIPDLSGLGNLQDFYVWYNHLEGGVPAPPQSLIDYAGTVSYAVGGLCPNALTPASDPPSSIDKAWSAITKTTPWSQDCAPDPLGEPDVNISSSPNISHPGEAVTFVAVVYGMHPTGTVTFKARSSGLTGDTPIITMCTDVPMVDAVATCTYSDLDPAGFQYSIYAFYSGDANNAPAHTFGVGSKATELYQYIKDPVVEATTDAAAQVGQPVDLTLTYDDLGYGVDGDTAGFFSGRYYSDSDGLHGDALCSKVPVHKSRSGQFIAHCVATFTNPGPHLLTASTEKSRANPDPIIEHVVAAKPFDADQFALTGPWYEPSTSGQGLEFVVYPDHDGDGVATLVGGWFTFDDAGQQRWLALQGDLVSSHGASFDLKVGQGSGGSFDVGPAIASAVIGSATLTFYDCTHAALTYNLDDGRSGTIPYVRLDQPTACSSAVPATPPAQPPANYADVLHGGAWYSLATSGQGLFVDIVPASTTFFGLWFTYAPPGGTDTGVARQRWFALQDNHYTPGDLALHDVAIVDTNGGVFNQPSAVDVKQVGTADITFNSCTSMTLTYHFNADAGEFSGLSGTIDEHALAPIPGCR